MTKLIENNIKIYYITPIPSVGWDAPKIVHKKLLRKELPFSTDLQHTLSTTKILLKF